MLKKFIFVLALSFISVSFAQTATSDSKVAPPTKDLPKKTLAETLKKVEEKKPEKPKIEEKKVEEKKAEVKKALPKAKKKQVELSALESAVIVPEEEQIQILNQATVQNPTSEQKPESESGSDYKFSSEPSFEIRKQVSNDVRIVQIEREELASRLTAYQRPSLVIGFGYAHSQWSEITNVLKDGSFFVSVGGTRPLGESWETGLSLFMLQGIQGNQSEENLYSVHFSADLRYYLLRGRVRPYSSLSLGFGSYRVWSLNAETDTAITYRKHAGGALIGLVPEIGTRFYFSSRFAMDVGVKYIGYLNNPAFKAGGWSAGLGLAFSH